MPYVKCLKPHGLCTANECRKRLAFLFGKPIEQRILDRVLQKPAAEPESSPLTDTTAWPGVPAHGLRWAV